MSAWRAEIALRPWLLLLAAALGGCHTAPATRETPAPQTHRNPTPAWDGGGGVAEMRHRGDALAKFALSLRGARYRYGGATPDGFDCSGLVFYTHRHFGLSVPRTSRDQAAQAEAVKPRKLRRGDLVFFRTSGRRVDHVGIYIGHHRFVHAPGAGKPVTVSSLDEDFYAETFDSAGRYWDRPPH